MLLTDDEMEILTVIFKRILERNAQRHDSAVFYKLSNAHAKVLEQLGFTVCDTKADMTPVIWEAENIKKLREYKNGNQT